VDNPLVSVAESACGANAHCGRGLKLAEHGFYPAGVLPAQLGQGKLPFKWRSVFDVRMKRSGGAHIDKGHQKYYQAHVDRRAQMQLYVCKFFPERNIEKEQVVKRKKGLQKPQEFEMVASYVDRNEKADKGDNDQHELCPFSSG